MHLITCLFTILGCLMNTTVSFVQPDHSIGLQSESLKSFNQIITEDELLRGIDHAEVYMNDLTRFENKMSQNRIKRTAKVPFKASWRRKKASPESMELAKKARRLLRVTRSLKEKGVADETLQLTSARFSVVEDSCSPIPVCETSKYRTIDGSCNNLQDTLLGKSFTTLRRFGPVDYSDGIEEPRVGQFGSSLPSARLVSAAVFPDVDLPDSELTMAVMQFGQFIDHDFGLVPFFLLEDGTEIECCSESGQFLPADELHPACFPITIPDDDRFYEAFGRKCMSFVRSIAGPTNQCTFGSADQLNENTQWLDGSQIYGSSEEKTALLRLFQGGKFRMSFDSNGRDLLPIYPSPCNSTTEGAPCFIAGDIRVEEMPMLTVMHIIWFREHNRVAQQLAALNPTWDDETLFQETRRIIVAELQHIIFAEWLPVILSPKTLERKGLLFAGSDSRLTNLFGNQIGNLIQTALSFFGTIFGVRSAQSYDPNLDAALSNEMTTAAFRMGHSLLQGLVRLYDESGRQVDSYRLSTLFNNPSVVMTDPEFLDRTVRGMLQQPSQSFDAKITTEVQDKLFRNVSRGEAFGMSLPALNIQRGRDHGIPGYNTYRKLCGLPRARDFFGLTNIPSYMVSRLMQVYETVDDIDLFVGGMLENPLRGGLLGPVFSCIMADQFSRWRRGDRFFYEVQGQPHSFSPRQLNEIRKASLARIFCDNSDGSVESIQPRAFHLVTASNRKVSCTSDDIPRLDLTLWQNEPI